MDLQKTRQQICLGLLTVHQIKLLQTLFKMIMMSTQMNPVKLKSSRLKKKIQKKHQDQSLFLYNPADSVPNPNFELLSDNIYNQIFNYKEPLNKQMPTNQPTIRNEQQLPSSLKYSKKNSDNLSQNPFPIAADPSPHLRESINDNTGRKSFTNNNVKPKNLTSQSSMIGAQFQTQQAKNQTLGPISGDSSVLNQSKNAIQYQSQNFEITNQLMNKRPNQRNSTLVKKETGKISSLIPNDEVNISIKNNKMQINRQDSSTLSQSINTYNNMSSTSTNISKQRKLITGVQIQDMKEEQKRSSFFHERKKSQAPKLQLGGNFSTHSHQQQQQNLINQKRK
ncbi:UNKNOWN [Stylonychia lemnae]|uniref:Uncharacterized protein n=1 Tax=Stylonychia lemnae TaxID=5949 RepID=A0A077ZQ57_STYLE|nr:UNKNOWN [Stylonychia lemnae]|eukprot:CDW71515.1 UNKNOWN [Stylonychia lemnae]